MKEIKFNKEELQEIEKHLFLSIQADKIYKSVDAIEIAIAEKFYRDLKNETLDVMLHTELARFIDIYIYRICKQQTDQELLKIGFSKENVKMIRRIDKFVKNYMVNVNG